MDRCLPGLDLERVLEMHDRFFHLSLFVNRLPEILFGAAVAGRAGERAPPKRFAILPIRSLSPRSNANAMTTPIARVPSTKREWRQRSIKSAAAQVSNTYKPMCGR